MIKQMIVSLVLFITTLATAEQLCNDQTRSTASTNYFAVDSSNPEVAYHFVTGLSWQRCPVGFNLNTQGTETTIDDSCDLLPDAPNEGRYTWEEAFDAVSAANPSLDVNGWRLPNIKELSWLVEYRCVKPAQNIAIFPRVNDDVFWSSTTHRQFVREVPVFDFSIGSNGFARRDLERHSVRLVIVGEQ